MTKISEKQADQADDVTDESILHSYNAYDTANNAGMHIQYLLHHAAKIAELQEIIIDKDYQGLGIGSALFLRIRETALAKKCAQLEVCCNRLRKESYKFYTKQGMTNSHSKFTLPLG